MTPTPETPAGMLTERIMAALRKAQVLKDDPSGRAANYNAAYSAVLSVLEAQERMERAAMNALAKRIK